MARGSSSTASTLAWLYAALIVYASLYPFAPWRAGATMPWEFLVAFPRFGVTRFDIVSNVAGYLPLGLLVFVAALRRGARPAAAMGTAALSGALLSLAMETAQNFVPVRVPSSLDLVTNIAGASAGAAVGALLQAAGGIGHWQGFRERWFIAGSGGGIALLLFWPLALLFPTPLPLGLGQGLGELATTLADALEGTSAQDWAREWIERADGLGPLPRAAELVAVACGLLAPFLVAASIVIAPARRLVALGGAIALGITATTLSTALNFGPQHALGWFTPTAALGLGAGATLAVFAAWLPARIAAGAGLIVICTLVALVVQAGTDPYFAQSLQAWEQGRFIRFHGAAQWVGWLWPFAALAYLLARLGAREDGS